MSAGGRDPSNIKADKIRPEGFQITPRSSLLALDTKLQCNVLPVRYGAILHGTVRYRTVPYHTGVVKLNINIKYGAHTQ